MSSAESNWRNCSDGGYLRAADEASATRPTMPVTRNTTDTPDAIARQNDVQGRPRNQMHDHDGEGWRRPGDEPERKRRDQSESQKRHGGKDSPLHGGVVRDGGFSHEEAAR